VTDSGTLTGATTNAGGSVTYTVYTDSSCTTVATTEISGQPPQVTVANATVPDSDPVTFLAAGTYYWQAAYSGDANNSGDTSACTDEPITIIPNAPTITTSLSASSASIGTPVTDSATLTGATTDAGGTVTYTVYTDSSCTTVATTEISGQPPQVTVAGGLVPNSDPVTFLAAGTYYWQAVYSGDANNSGDTSACTDEPITIDPNSPAITTAVVTTSPQTALATIIDSAKLTGATTNAGGTVVYSLYSNSLPPVCVAANLKGTDTETVAAGTVPNGTFSNVPAGTYELQAVYSGDPNNNGATSTCGTEPFTVTQASPTVATSLSASTGAIGTSVTDSTTLTGDSTNAGGKVTYTVYTDNSCTTPASTTQISAQPPQVNVTNALVPDSDPVTFLAAGTYYWQAVYSGDANNAAAASLCTSEPITINPNDPAITTTLSASTAAIGTPVTDAAKLTGATDNAGGTVTYTVYTDNACTAPATISQISAQPHAVTVINAAVPDSAPVSFLAAGTYYWQAVYSGDDNNTGDTSACTSEQIIIAPNNPTIATTLDTPSPQTALATITDSAKLTGATSDAAGQVTYGLYAGSGAGVCAPATPVATSIVTVTGGIVPDGSFANVAAGTYEVQAAYSGDLNNNGATSACGTEPFVVDPAVPTIATTLSASTSAIGAAVTDSATLTGASTNAGGTVTYTVYIDSSCATAATTQISGQPTQVTVTDGAVPGSDPVTFLAAGTYYWQAVYSGDANNRAAASVCTTEPITITKNSTAITTTLVTVSPQTALATITDSATLAGATTNAGGMVAYRLYPGHGTGVCASGRPVGIALETVTDGNVPNGTFSNVPAGFYEAQAVYSGDANNAGASSVCGTEPFIVEPTSPTIATTLVTSSPQVALATITDSATVAGATPNAGGTVLYILYKGTGPGACIPANHVVVSPAAVNDGIVSNGTFINVPAGNYELQAFYTGDFNNLFAISTCGTEPFTVTPAVPTIATHLSTATAGIGTPVTDSATLTGATANAGGTVTYTVYTDNTCTTPATGQINAQPPVVTVTNASVPPSASVTFLAAGTYYWQAHYSGDANNSPVDSVCTTEPITITPNNPTITTKLSASSAAIGASVTDASKLTGATANAGGTVTYTVYTDDTCTTQASTSQISAQPPPVNVTNGVAPDSGPVTFLVAGHFFWQAVYSGDANNSAAASLCNSEPLTIVPNSTTITTKLVTTSPQLAPVVITDSVTLAGATLDAGGTVTYNLYAGVGSTACEAANRIADTTVTVSGGTVPNGTFNGVAAGNYELQAVYSGDANNHGATSACGTEPFTALPLLETAVFDGATRAPWKGTETTGASAFDTATLTGKPNITPTGTVTYTFFTNSDCTGTGAPAGTVTLTATGAVPNSTTQGPLTPGTHSFRASYSGDSTYTSSTSPCEPFAVGIGTSKVDTSVADASTSTVVTGAEPAGMTAYDRATVTGAAGVAPTGTVTYFFFTNGTCTGTGRPAGTVTVGATGTVPNSNTQGPLGAGAYSFHAVYSGDSNYHGSAAACEPFTVASSPPPAPVAPVTHVTLPVTG
jgi:hypothetical protein